MKQGTAWRDSRASSCTGAGEQGPCKLRSLKTTDPKVHGRTMRLNAAEARRVTPGSHYVCHTGRRHEVRSICSTTETMHMAIVQCFADPFARVTKDRETPCPLTLSKEGGVCAKRQETPLCIQAVYERGSQHVASTVRCEPISIQTSNQQRFAPLKMFLDASMHEAPHNSMFLHRGDDKTVSVSTTWKCFLVGITFTSPGDGLHYLHDLFPKPSHEMFDAFRRMPRTSSLISSLV